jgi:septal ring factor EnvC (AmiA/AmiB activator)
MDRRKRIQKYMDNMTNEIRPGIDLAFLTLTELNDLKAILTRQTNEHSKSAISERSRKALINIEREEAERLQNTNG